MTTQLKPTGYKDFFLWLIRRRQRFRITGNSMLPLLKPGDDVLINPFAFKNASPQPGDIVVARHPLKPDTRLIKRVITDTEAGDYILQGDNPAESTDSRAFGAVPARHILGRVVSRFG
jgi:nickel-type superoxide dismutase maturation protease